MPTRPRALLFDLDGTLVDSIELLLGAFRHAFSTTLGRVPDESRWIAGIGTPLVAQMRGLVDDERDVERLIASYRAFQHEHHDRLVHPYHGTADVLAALRARGHPVGVVTSKGIELARRALAHTGLDAYIDALVGYEQCTRHKPEPEPVEVALDLLGYPPEEALFAGDSPHDIRAGNAAGVVTVAALWGPFTREALAAAHPDYLIAGIRDLPALVARLEAAPATER